MSFTEKMLAAMEKRFGGLATSWQVGDEKVEVSGILHRHQTERNREQKQIYAAEGVVPQPHLCLLVAASAVEGKPWALADKPVEPGMVVTVGLESGATAYRCETCELSADQSHFIIALCEDAEEVAVEDGGG